MASQTPSDSSLSQRQGSFSTTLVADFEAMSTSSRIPLMLHAGYWPVIPTVMSAA
jgi:hypothetical protein